MAKTTNKPAKVAAPSNDELPPVEGAKAVAKGRGVNSSLKAAFEKSYDVKLDQGELHPPKWRKFNEKDFSGVDMRDLAPESLAIKNGDYTGSDLSGANFSGMNLQGSIFRNADLTDANFEDADVRWSDFTGSNYQDAYWGEGATVANIRETVGIELN